MLKQLRSKKTMKRIMKITLILIIPSFIVLYGWSSMSRTGSRSGGWYYIKVKESPFQIFRWSQVSDSEMKEAKNRLLMEYQGLLGIQNRQMATQVEKLITPVDIAREALNNKALSQMAGKKNIRGTLPELTAYIEKLYPQAPKTALAYLMNSRGFQPGQEEAFARSELYRMTLEKTRFLYASRAKASLFELWQEYLLMEEQVKVSYVPFKAVDYEEQASFTDEDIQTHYDENKEEYRIPNQVKYEYIAIRKNTLISDARTTETEIRAYYEANRETEYKVDTQVKVRNIQLNLDPEAGEEEEGRIKALADDLYTSLTERGADFAGLADRFSEDPANTQPQFGPDQKPTGVEIKKGGLLGFWSRKDLEKSPYGKTIVEAALGMKEGDISIPLKGERGFHILKAETVEPEHYIAYEDARDQARYAIKREKAEKVFEEKRKILYDRFEETTTLSGLAAFLDIQTMQTDLIDEDATYVPGVGGLSKFKSELMSLQEGETSDLLETPALLAVLKVIKRVSSHIPELDEIKDNVEADVKQQKAMELAEKDARALREQAGSLEELKSLAGEKGYDIESPEPFVHTKPPTEFENIENVAQLTIQTKPGQIRLSRFTGGRYQKQGGGYMVWGMEEKIEPDREKFTKDLPELQRQYLQGKQKTIVEENLADMRENLEYEINPAFLGIGE